jgi:hypothetical protein
MVLSLAIRGTEDLKRLREGEVETLHFGLRKLHASLSNIYTCTLGISGAGSEELEVQHHKISHRCLAKEETQANNPYASFPIHHLTSLLRAERRQACLKSLLPFLILTSRTSPRHKILNLHMRTIGRYVLAIFADGRWS